MIDRFVIFGALGDLTARYLLPALARLREAGRVSRSLQVVGVARAELETEAFRGRVAGSLHDHAGDVSAEARDELVGALEYRRADATEPAEVASAVGADRGPFVAYLALPPAVFLPALDALAKARPPRGSRIVVEKPFGEDLASARELNAAIRRSFPEDATFRIDHFLHKQTVQNILGLRFANSVFEPAWNRRHVDRVEIVWDETITAEGRASYYDGAGALEDMLQNHLLQLLSLVAMEPPVSMSERDLRDRKADVLRAVAPPPSTDMATSTLRGRYGAGRVGGRDVAAYVDEDGVDARREAETFAEVVMQVDNRRWADVPFVLRSGKALGEDRRFVAIRFREPPHPPFGAEQRPEPNELRFELSPDRLALEVSINGEGDPFDLEAAELDARLAPQDLPAYSRLLLDVLEGDPTLSIRDDEAEESWRIVEPVARAWREGAVPLVEYPAGSDGPGGSRAASRRRRNRRGGRQVDTG